MIFGADSQNKNLRIASKIKSDPSGKTRTSNTYSAAVSSSKTAGRSNAATGNEKVVHQSRSAINDGNPDPVRGSMEGLDKGKSAYIQQNGVGYDSKSQHSARYADKTKTINTVKGASFLFTNQQNKGIISNYTKSTAAGSSSQRMSKGLEINRYF